jgi:hypothetical protein
MAVQLFRVKKEKEKKEVNSIAYGCLHSPSIIASSPRYAKEYIKASSLIGTKHFTYSWSVTARSAFNQLSLFICTNKVIESFISRI